MARARAAHSSLQAHQPAWATRAQVRSGSLVQMVHSVPFHGLLTPAQRAHENAIIQTSRLHRVSLIPPPKFHMQSGAVGGQPQSIQETLEQRGRREKGKVSRLGLSAMWVSACRSHERQYAHIRLSREPRVSGPRSAAQSSTSFTVCLALGCFPSYSKDRHDILQPMRIL